MLCSKCHEFWHEHFRHCHCVGTVYACRQPNGCCCHCCCCGCCQRALYMGYVMYVKRYAVCAPTGTCSSNSGGASLWAKHTLRECNIVGLPPSPHHDRCYPEARHLYAVATTTFELQNVAYGCMPSTCSVQKAMRPWLLHVVYYSCDNCPNVAGAGWLHSRVNRGRKGTPPLTGL